MSGRLVGALGHGGVEFKGPVGALGHGGAGFKRPTAGQCLEHKSCCGAGKPVDPVRHRPRPTALRPGFEERRWQAGETPG